MSILRFQPHSSVYLDLRQQARACGELWNIAMTQRRNKYSWGKANADTQMSELKSIQSLDSQFERVPYAALQQVILDLDTAYAEFLSAKDAFKRHERERMPEVPALKSDGFLYPVYYPAAACTINNQSLQLSPQPEAEPLLIPLTPDASLDVSEGVWILPEESSWVRVYSTSSKEAGRMALKEANSTKGTEISGSSPRG